MSSKPADEPCVLRLARCTETRPRLRVKCWPASASWTHKSPWQCRLVQPPFSAAFILSRLPLLSLCDLDDNYSVRWSTWPETRLVGAEVCVQQRPTLNHQLALTASALPALHQMLTAGRRTARLASHQPAAWRTARAWQRRGNDSARKQTRVAQLQAPWRLHLAPGPLACLCASRHSIDCGGRTHGS